MTRTQWMLIGLLALQALLLAIWATGDDSTAVVAARPLFPDLGQAEPARIEIVDGGEEAGEPLVIERHEGDWVLPASDGFPADAEKIRQLLDRLGGLEVRRPVVSGTRYHEALEVAESKFVRRVRVTDTDGGSLADLWLGSSPNYQVVDVRAAGDDRVYEARGLSSWDFNPDSSAWIDTGLIDLEVADVVEVRVENRSGRFTLRRETDDDGGESWWLTGGGESREADRSKVETFVRRLATLRLSEPVGRVDPAVHGLERPAARVELVTRGGEGPGADESEPTSTVTLLVGGEAPDSDGKFYATRAGLGFAVLIGKWDADPILDRAAADL